MFYWLCPCFSPRLVTSISLYLISCPNSPAHCQDSSLQTICSQIHLYKAQFTHILLMLINPQWLPLEKVPTASLTFNNGAVIDQARLPLPAPFRNPLLSPNCSTHCVPPSKLSFCDPCLQNHTLWPPLFITQSAFGGPDQASCCSRLALSNRTHQSAPSLLPIQSPHFTNSHWTVIATLGHSAL